MTLLMVLWKQRKISFHFQSGSKHTSDHILQPERDKHTNERYLDM